MSDISTHHRFLILNHRRQGKTPPQIATLIRKEPSQVIRVLKAMGLEPNTLLAPKVAKRQSAPKNIGAYHCKAKDPAPMGNPEGENPVRTAEIILRNRLTTLRGIEMLDGTPATLDRKMREANRVLFQRGKGPHAQLGRNPAWHVTEVTRD